VTAHRCLALVLMLSFALADPGHGRTAPELKFSPPLGFGDKVEYAPRELRASGKLIEDTRYGVKNPDLHGATCFGVPWPELYHAGQDLYRADGKSTAGAAITAVADGDVVHANPDLNYPGLVVIIRHTLDPASGAAGVIYSVYAHLDDNSLEVAQGQQVKRGDLLGEVMYQAYTGRFPEHHPDGDDSHLHFELRRFYNARNLYTQYPACNGLVAGRGYTYPSRPEVFPTKEQGYLDPEEYTGR
jgi:murein DD-endopeptidase MepM/ murein hydrolase activator NlpD